MFSVRTIFILLFITAFGLGVFHVPPAGAHEKGQDNKQPEKMPATLDGIWHEVKEHQQELETVIQKKELSSVHEIAFHIRDLVYAMSDKSATLPAASLSKVKMNSKYLGTLAGRLDEAGDANDQTRTEETYKQFSNLLKSIEAQYPPGALKYTGKE
jgi:hypothetical protein